MTILNPSAELPTVASGQRSVTVENWVITGTSWWAGLSRGFYGHDVATAGNQVFTVQHFSNPAGTTVNFNQTVNITDGTYQILVDVKQRAVGLGQTLKVFANNVEVGSFDTENNNPPPWKVDNTTGIFTVTGGSFSVRFSVAAVDTQDRAISWDNIRIIPASGGGGGGGGGGGSVIEESLPRGILRGIKRGVF
jgi:hypothetical protein